MTKVVVSKGTYRNTPIKNETFELVRGIAKDIGKNGSFILVKPTKNVGDRTKKTVRITVAKRNIKVLDSSSKIHKKVSKKSKKLVSKSTPKSKTKIKRETDKQVIARITERFDILEEMTKATIASDIKAMIVSGPPGVGKSYGVEKQLEKASMFDVIARVNQKYEVIKGAITPIGLYATLYKHSGEGNVLVFDDCDMVLQDDLSLNLLKAALDSGKKRRVFWNADSHLLRREGIPDSFDFEGAVIFITNLKFNHIRSKKLQDHLEALQSRCHYLDLTLDTMRDKVLRVKQIAETGELFNDYKLNDNQGMEIIKFMETHKNDLREMSLRMALKIADLRIISERRWKLLAKNTCMKTSF
jgi:hypothetical protein